MGAQTVPRGRPVKFSVVVPAHNEERCIGGCLESIRRAARPFSGDVETLVVLNRCTDKTERIAAAAGARIVREDGRCLSKIRNAGARQAQGEILVTIDADSRMSPDMMAEIARALASGRIIGGGVRVVPDRVSAGITVSLMLLRAALRLTGLAGGSYWCRRGDFEELGGFSEALVMGEDLEFARRLKLLGRRRGQCFITLPRAYIVTSMRKFDRFGDWFFLRTAISQARLKMLAKWKRGAYEERERRFADDYFYEWSDGRSPEREDVRRP